jgi:hypothetical protein
MAIIGSAYDRDVGGAQGTGYTGLPYSSSYGIDAGTWLSFSKREQELWIQDVNRTQAQQDYSTDSDYAKVYEYKEKADEYVIDPIIDGGEQVYDDFKGAVSYGFDSGILLLAGAAILLLNK